MTSVPVTRPKTGENTRADSPLSVCPISCPFLTVSPSRTTGSQGAPMCWERGTLTIPGAGMARTASPSERDLRSGGCTPRLKVNLFNPKTPRPEGQKKTASSQPVDFYLIEYHI